VISQNPWFQAICRHSIQSKTIGENSALAEKIGFYDVSNAKNKQEFLFLITF
jgi:hypothetical protein